MQIRGNFSDFFFETALPAMNVSLKKGYNQKPMQMTKLFQVLTSDRSIEQTSGVSGLGLFGQIAEGGEPRYDSMIQEFDKTFRHQKYGLAVPATRELIEDDKFSIISGRARELGFSSNETIEVQAASVFNNAFTAGSYAGPDGVALCSASHPLVKAGGTQSNVLSVAADLDHDSLELALIDYELQKRSNGQQITLPAPRLLVAPQNRFRANEIIKSEMRSDTANNAINPLAFAEGVVSDIIVWAKLTDPDAWFLVAPPASTGLVWFWRKRPTPSNWVDDATESGYVALRYRASWGFSDYLGVYGTPGA